MSINALGLVEPINTDAQPGTPNIPISIATHLVEASSFIDTNVNVTLANVPITALNASALNSTSVSVTLASVPIAAYAALVVATPVSSNDTDITAGAATMPFSAKNASVSADYVGVDQNIGNITVSVLSWHDMGQYIYDAQGRVTNSQILNLNPAIATYSHSNKRLTGVSEGTMTGLQLEVTYT